MSNVKARDFEEVVKRWMVREVERLETFLRLVALGCVAGRPQGAGHGACMKVRGW